MRKAADLYCEVDWGRTAIPNATLMNLPRGRTDGDVKMGSFVRSVRLVHWQ
jgi:hypothetical protein